MNSPGKVCKRLFGPPVAWIGAFLFFFEELLWKGLGRMMAALAQWSVIARLETLIQRLPPYGAVLLFAVPFALVLPIKLTALWLIGRGEFLSGLLLFACGNLMGTAILARIYLLCRPALSTLGWFVRLESAVLRWRNWAHRLLERLPGWRAAKQTAHKAVETLRRLAQINRHHP